VKRINNSFNSASIQSHQHRVDGLLKQAKEKGLLIEKVSVGWNVVYPNGDKKNITSTHHLSQFITEYKTS
jgi:hypothetical protein